MAPEIEARNPYNCKQADLFALTVILFILMTGRPPFQAATKSDNRFKSISVGKGLFFWQGLPDSI